jgi:carbon storage regulator
MLILTRRPGERVVIGDEILVTVMGVSGHTVRLGIAAPQGVPIYREEIWLAVKEENRAAAAVEVDALPSGPPETPPEHPATRAEDPGASPEEGGLEADGEAAEGR